MAKGKYGYRIQQSGDAWTAEITRKVSNRKTVVSKKQDGFTSESEANEWAQNELASFLKTLEKSHQNKAIKREKAAERLKEKLEDAEAQKEAEKRD